MISDCYVSVFKWFSVVAVVLVSATISDANASFEELPDDVLKLVFSNNVLTVQDLGRCAQVSRKWQINSSSNVVWEKHVNAAFKFGIPFCRAHSDTINKIYNSIVSPQIYNGLPSPQIDVKRIMAQILRDKTASLRRTRSQGDLDRVQTSTRKPRSLQPQAFKMLIAHRDDIALELRQQAMRMAVSEKAELKQTGRKLIVSLEYLGDEQSVLTYLNTVEVELSEAGPDEAKLKEEKDSLIKLGSEVAKEYN
jgi:hypothetical protein